MKKGDLVTLVIILLILAFSGWVLLKNPNTDEELARCIGENSVVYSQIGCHACETQKQLFGENYQYINDYICNTNWDYCLEKGIEATPTWEINGQIIEGVQTIEKLKKLTGC